MKSRILDLPDRDHKMTASTVLIIGQLPSYVTTALFSVFCHLHSFLLITQAALV